MRVLLFVTLVWNGLSAQRARHSTPSGASCLIVCLVPTANWPGVASASKRPEGAVQCTAWGPQPTPASHPTVRSSRPRTHPPTQRRRQLHARCLSLRFPRCPQHRTPHLAHVEAHAHASAGLQVAALLDVHHAALPGGLAVGAHLGGSGLRRDAGRQVSVARSGAGARLDNQGT